jgi:hypothetical protein
MILGIANDRDSDAKTIGCCALRNRFGRVVGTFGVNVRAQIFEQRVDARVAEEDDVIDRAKRGDEESSGVLVEYRAARTF